MSFVKQLAAVALVLAFVCPSESCDGYSLTMLGVRHCKGCEDNQVFRFVGPVNLTLTKECRLLSYGCVEWDEFSKAELKFNLYRNNRCAMKRSVDLCEAANDSDISVILGAFGFSKVCPSESGKKCVHGEKAINITNKKSMILALLNGNPTLKFDVEHENGRRSCYELDLAVTKDQ